MAEEKKDKKKQAEEGEAPPPPPPPSKKKLYIAIGAGVAALIVIVVVVLVVFSKNEAPVDTHDLAADAAKVEDNKPQAEGAGEEEELQPGEEPLGAFLPLETFVLNLSGGKYIRVQIQYEFNGRDVPKRLYPRMVPLRDAIISLITSKSAEELTSEKGKEALRAELRDIVNEMLKKEEVRRVYFTQFVIQ
jgi:flagellar protein FliL